jgi:glycosyltransferase involved in cell wall biosynthesis
MKHKVLVYKPDLLPYSETFIKEQVLAYRSWQGALVGHRRVPNGLPLNGVEIRLLLGDPPSRGEKWLWRLRRWIGVVSKAEIRQLEEENAQILHAHFGTVAVDIWPLARALGLPMMVTLHGYDINIRREWWENGHGGWRRRRYPKQLLALAREPHVHFIAVSEAIRRRAIDFGIPVEKITVCYIGVDTERFRPGGMPISQRPSRVLFVGRLIEKKGAAYLIEAFSDISRKIPDAELVIVGDGPLRQQLETQARATSARITFLGALNNDQIKLQLDQARIFCLPSITASNGDAEGLPIVILEALACGVPVVTSARGAVGEAVVNNESGFTFPERDIARLITLLTSLLTDNSLVERCSLNARQHIVSHFALTHKTELLEQIYERWLDASREKRKKELTSR